MSEEYKKIHVEFKEQDGIEGKVQAVFSLFDDIDSDGDVVLPSAIKSGFDPVNDEVPMVWAHQWDKPIGRGKIVKDDSKAVFDGEFFMDTESGNEAYKLVKNMGNLQQWSFGFRVNDSEFGKFKKDNEDETEVRYLKDLSVYEVSPVLVGANQDTFTMAIKSQNQDQEEKGVLGHDSIQKENPDEEEKGYGKDKCDYDESGKCKKESMKDSEKAALAEDMFSTPSEAEQRARELGCQGSHMHDVDGMRYFMPCPTHEDYEARIKKYNTALQSISSIAKGIKEVLNIVPTDEKSLDHLKQITESIDCLLGKDNKVSEKSASVQGKRFSDEVKDVLAALNNLVARVQSIGELRAKNGRKLGVSATEALRTVQESVQDAFDEIDKFVEEFGSEGALEDATEVVDEVEVQEETETEVSEPVAEVEETVEEPKDENPEEKPTEEPEVDTGEEREVEDPVDELPTEEVVDNELDDLWLDSQRIATETILTDIEIVEEVEI